MMILNHDVFFCGKKWFYWDTKIQLWLYLNNLKNSSAFGICISNINETFLNSSIKEKNAHCLNQGYILSLCHDY